MRHADQASTVASRRPIDRNQSMSKDRLKRGDHVSWNSEAGRVRGRITRVVTKPIKFKGYTVHATRDEPQYEIKSDTTDHVAMHKRSALTKLRQ
jgi:Hypervirulence associated proteins TUDOR domain